ncbi:MAG: SH3 domain-containing protein [Anaerolineaceae bacterium]|nr:SH3 domain-containing protein [Anaerolineaceae bacterium]
MTNKVRLLGLFMLMAILSVTASVSAQATPTSTPMPNPNANITWPPPVYVVRGLFTVYGTANLPNMTGWFLEARPIDSLANEDEGWTPVTLVSRTPVENSVLAVWDTSIADDGVYSLRLNVSLSNNTRVYALITPIRVENDPPPFAGIATGQPGNLPTPGSLPTLLPTPTAFSTSPQATARINANVRRGDGTIFEVIGNLPAGTTVQIIGVSSLGTNWYLVVLPNGQQGWVAPSVVDVSGNLASVPRVNPPTPPTPTPIPVTATPTSTINLVAGNFRFDPGSPNCAQTFNIYMDVANFGSSFSPSGTISINDYRQADGAFQTSTVGAFPAIAPGQTINVGPIPLTVSTYYNENHRLLMTVDGSNLIFETNENDNTKEAIYLLNKANCP